jgi:hypothetical protein
MITKVFLYIEISEFLIFITNYICNIFIKFLFIDTNINICNKLYLILNPNHIQGNDDNDDDNEYNLNNIDSNKRSNLILFFKNCYNFIF